ncbi:MAG: outer membrane beta-barrel protein [Bacteroidaceae bacterium]|nr:outer membrane beta-barrel protein [Bacteroidaceae bacterium]
MRTLYFRCGKLRILPLLCLFLGMQTAQADVIKGLVVDAETMEPLPDASVKMIQKTDNATFTTTTRADSLGVFYIHANGKCTIEASMLGYYSKTKTVLAFNDSQKDTLDIGTIELKMSPQMLRMVEVTGRARRFTVRGDTIVFHPEAFHLQEGARLDELIRQLPGVEVDGEGKMWWNGKPIRLTMDGESMLGGDQLMKQLPVEAVHDIKAYNKASEFSERTGKNDGTQDMVLDLTIKPGFLDRWYGDVTVGYQTPEYYEGELTMNRLSKSDPVMVSANANNLNKNIRKTMSGWSSSMGSGYGQEQGAAAGYQHKWNKKERTQELRSQYSFTGGVAHDDKWNTTHEETENYMPNTDATRNSSETYDRNHKLAPRLNADLRWAIDSLNTFSLRASVEHKNKRSHSRQTIEQEEAQDANTPYTSILSQQNNAHSNGRETALSTSTGWEHYIKDGSLGASLELNYIDGKDSYWMERTVTSHTESITPYQLNQHSTSPYSYLYASAEAHHNRWLTKKWMMQMQYSYQYSHDNNDCDFMTNGVDDTANSYRDHHTNNRHHLRLSSTINLSPVQIMPNVTARWQRESQDYQRGLLDTAAVRNVLLIDPSVRATWKLSKTAGFELNYGFSTSQPRIILTIGYRDLTDPLFITEGNPDLKDSHNHNFGLSYNMMLARSQTSLHASIGHQTNDRDRVTALSYNPTTAVYVSRPENIQGGHNWDFRLNIDQALGEMFRLENDFRLNTEEHYGYLTLLPTQTEHTLNRQTDFHPRDRLTLSFDKNGFKASAFVSIEVDRLRFSASPEQNTTLWDNAFGFNAEATMGNFVFATDLTEFTHRGYTVQSMNRNILLWNAAVTWKILKNKARLELDFEDILNKQDSFWSFSSAYQRTTSWRDFRHHYINLTFTYHLDAKNKD